MTLDTELHNKINRIKDTLCLDDDDFCEMLGATSKELERIRKRHSDYSLAHVVRLGEALGLSVNVLLMGDIDYLALARQFQGDVMAMPERYAPDKLKLGWMRSVKSMLRLASMIRNEYYSTLVYKRLQLHPATLSASPDTPISPLITMDLIREFKSDGFTDQEIRSMGGMTAVVMRDTPVGRALADCHSATEIYRSIFEQHTYAFDRFWGYRLLKMTDQSLTMEITLKEESATLFRTRELGNRQACLFLQGVFMTLPKVANLPDAKLLESECRYQGGSRCVYHLSWNSRSLGNS